MTIEPLQERGEYWQDVMGLNTWKIRFTYALPHELKDAWADADYDQYHQTALIRVLHPQFSHLQKWPVPEYDVDFSLVHELVHLMLDPLNVNDVEEGPEFTNLEQTVNKITEVIISLENQANEQID